MERRNGLPAICWLKVTGYIHGWLQYELGGDARVQDRRVVCVQHLPGARKKLRMRTEDDTMEPVQVKYAMSATRWSCINIGLQTDEKVTKEMYGIDRETMALFVPIECPENCMTDNGVLRPWTCDTVFGKEQAKLLREMLHEAFWQAVEDYADNYALQHEGEEYAQVKMIEAFCSHTDTPDLYVEAIRREWQRRKKRGSRP